MSNEQRLREALDNMGDNLGRRLDVLSREDYFAIKDSWDKLRAALTDTGVCSTCGGSGYENDEWLYSPPCPDCTGQDQGELATRDAFIVEHGLWRDFLRFAQANKLTVYQPGQRDEFGTGYTPTDEEIERAKDARPFDTTASQPTDTGVCSNPDCEDGKIWKHQGSIDQWTEDCPDCTGKDYLGFKDQPAAEQDVKAVVRDVMDKTSTTRAYLAQGPSPAADSKTGDSSAASGAVEAAFKEWRSGPNRPPSHSSRGQRAFLSFEAGAAWQARSLQEWRPISEAPKDGKPVYLLKNTGTIYCARWLSANEIADREGSVEVDDFEAGWGEINDLDEPLYGIISWMPALPQPPTEGTGG